MARLTNVMAVLLVAAVAMTVSGCAGGSAMLKGTTWKLVGWSVSSINPSDFTITAAFADGQISGNSAVNSYGASYSTGPGDAFKASEIASTLMAGPEDAMRAESAYIELLLQARSFKVDGSRLTLFDEGGNESLIFKSTAK